jgi:hypothetical protein
MVRRLSGEGDKKRRRNGKDSGKPLNSLKGAKNLIPRFCQRRQGTGGAVTVEANEGGGVNPRAAGRLVVEQASRQQKSPENRASLGVPGPSRTISEGNLVPEEDSKHLSMCLYMRLY